MSSFIDSHKALVITTLLSSIVVLMAFTVHIKKNSAFDAETYYDLTQEEEEILKEQEELADLIKSLDEVISSNRAHNETKRQDDFDEEAFQNTMNKLKNRSSQDLTQETQKEYLTSSSSSSEDQASFNSINDLISNKRTTKSENRSTNKNSSVRFSLVDRMEEYLPPPVYLCEEGGKIVVTIKVDSKGNVIETTINSSSTSTNGCLIDHAIEYAKASKFNVDLTKQNQLGTITFYFRGKS